MTYLRFTQVLIFIIGLILISCNDDDLEDRSYPSLDTKDVSDINTNGATLNADLLSIGSNGVSDHGFVYDDNQSPMLEGSDRISLGGISSKRAYSALVNRNLVKDRKYYVRAYAISEGNNLVVYGQQVAFVSQGGSEPEITDFYPKQGVAGDTITVVGTGFSDIAINNKIKFGLITSNLIEAYEDSLICTVPRMTLTGQNELFVTVGQHTVSSEEKFTLNLMEFTSFSPEQVSFADTVTIVGKNFARNLSYITISALGKDSFVLNVSSNQIQFVVSNNVVISDSKIALNAGVQSLNSTEDILLKEPVIANFTPMQATNNTEVSISGSHFSPVNGNNIVTINGVDLTILEASKTNIKVRIPSGMVPGSYPISLTRATQNVISSTEIEIIEPKIIDVTPLTGTWGDVLTITGVNFGSEIQDNIVKFNELTATIVSASENELTVIVPDNLLVSSSNLSIQVLTVDGLSTQFADAFVLDAPTISGFSVDEGRSNTEVIIYGTNFNPQKNNQVVKFGERTVEILEASSTELKVKTPTSVEESDVYVTVDLAEQNALSPATFHFISPWKRIGDFGGNAKWGAVSFTLNNFGYVTTGTDAAGTLYVKPCWKYDPSTDQWSEVKGFSYSNWAVGGSYYNLSAFTIGDFAYAGIAMSINPTTHTGFMRYSPADDKWFPAAIFIGGKAEAAVAFSINDKGYSATGRYGVLTSKMWEYDPTTDSWAGKADLPGAGRMEATGFSIGSYGYVIGGYPALKDCWRYDPANDTWTPIATYPGVNGEKMTGFVVDGYGYVVGSDFWKYDPENNLWSKLDDFPGVKRTDAVAFVINGKAYYGTGYGNNSALKDFWEFDPSKLD